MYAVQRPLLCAKERNIEIKNVSLKIFEICCFKMIWQMCTIIANFVIFDKQAEIDVVASFCRYLVLVF